MYQRDLFKPVFLFRRRGFVALGLLLSLSAGCQQHDQRVRADQGGQFESPIEPRWSVLGNSVQGRPIACLAFGDGEDCVLIMATIHGDEDAGTPLVRRLAAHLADHPALAKGRRILLIPVVNPDGRVNRSRTNARGVDLNRNYPAANYQRLARHGDAALSEPETVAISGLLDEHRPRRIVSIHQPLRSGHACIDYDGPADALAAAMAAHCRLPIEKIGSRPGSLGSYAGLTLGVPIITLELPKDAGAMSADEIWSRWGRMMLAAIAFPEAIPTQAADVSH